MIEIMSDHIVQLFEGGFRRTLAESEPLFHAGDCIDHMHLVIEGQVGLCRQTRMGIELRLQTARPGEVVAEASAYSQVYHCDARANARSTIICIPVETFRSRLNDNHDAADAWAAYLARAVQTARTSAEIRTLRTVADRLDAWLGENGTVPEKGTWTELAAELGLSREALYRELGKRRRRIRVGSRA